MFPTLNRYAMIVTPKQPFVDWLHGADPTGQDLTPEDITEPTFYLLPACDNEQDLIAHVKNYSDTIFEDQLDAWFTDRSTWSAERDFGTFCLWFEYRAHTLLIDLCDNPPGHDS